MGQIRVELMTPALSERCSNQLSYCPKKPYSFIFITKKIIKNTIKKNKKKIKKKQSPRKTGKESKDQTQPKSLAAQPVSTHSLCFPLALQKEVIQPHLPVRLPCYDFTPLTSHTLDGGPSCELSYRLRVSPARMV